MSKQRDYTDYLQDMLESIQYAEQFIMGISYRQFEKDTRTQYAVLYAITIIGEATNKIPANVRDQYPEVPWRTIIDTRNRLVHGYESVLLRLVWKIVTDDISALKLQIAAILADLADKKGDSL